MAPKKIRRVSEESALTDFEEMRQEALELYDGEMLKNKMQEIDELELEEADRIIEIKTETRDLDD